MTNSSAIHSCLQLPSSSLCRSCWWRRLVFVAVFFLLLLYPTFFLLLYHVAKIHVSKCVESIWVFAVVVCLKYSCFSALSGELIHLLLCLRSWSFPFSTKPTFQKLLASVYQPWLFCKFRHHKERRSTLCILQSSSLKFKCKLNLSVRSRFCSQRLTSP